MTFECFLLNLLPALPLTPQKYCQYFPNSLLPLLALSFSSCFFQACQNSRRRTRTKASIIVRFFVYRSFSSWHVSSFQETLPKYQANPEPSLQSPSTPPVPPALQSYQRLSGVFIARGSTTLRRYNSGESPQSTPLNSGDLPALGRLERHVVS